MSISNTTPLTCAIINESSVKRHLPNIPQMNTVDISKALEIVHMGDLPEEILPFVDDLCTKIQNNTLTPKQEKLIECLEPLLVWRVFYRYVESWPINGDDYLKVGNRQLDHISALGLAAARCVLYREYFIDWFDKNYK